MPVDTTRVIPTRRTQKKITEEELKDIELKRIRGAYLDYSHGRVSATNLPALLLVAGYR
jgi:hypothetical protein